MSYTGAGKKFMDVVTYTGNDSSQSIGGLDFSPDLVWIKNRGAVSNHRIYDTIRGASNHLYSNLTNAEASTSNTLSAFNSDGFDVSGTGIDTNASGSEYVAWTWDAGSSTVTNNDGSITSQVRANPSAGFSIVSYTGDGSSGATIGHGLNAAPYLMLVKSRSDSAYWEVYHSSIGNTKTLYLNTTDSEQTSSASWNNTTPSSTVFTVGNGSGVNTLSSTYVAYCWAPVEGYSAFGSYTGNGSTDGPFVYTGFRPKFLLVKLSSGSTDNWFIQDTSRSPSNVSVNTLSPDNTNTESSGTFNSVDILSNGFKLRDSNQNFNGTTYTYVYAAFAEHPFKTSRAR
jgi:hypothetical protein